MKRGIFCQTKAATNEEYRKELKSRNWWLLLMLVCGAVAAIAALVVENTNTETVPDYMLGVYCGTGTGIMLGCLVLVIRNFILLKNEEKLKQSRLENYDERNAEIQSKAIIAAVKVMLLVCLVVALVGGIYYQYLFKIMLFIVYVFLFSYLIANSYYRRKM